MSKDLEALLSLLKRSVDVYAGMVGRQQLTIEMPPPGHSDPDARVVEFRGKRYLLTLTLDPIE